jgi:Ni,Fe-hydrogenase III large subunit
MQFEPYQGAKTTPVMPGLCMGGSVVVHLLSELDLSHRYHVFFDNLFTSLKLMDFLTNKGAGATGNIRVNRIENCTVADIKKMTKVPRGSSDHRLDTANNVEVVRWHDNSVVTNAFNKFGTKPLVKAKRWSSAEKKSD